MSNRGLGRAVLDGFSAAKGEFIACIDCDLQHDLKILPAMVEALDSGADLSVGCRYMEGGGIGDWNWWRRFESKVATRMAQFMVGAKLNDPMSGFFMMRRSRARPPGRQLRSSPLREKK